MEERISIDKCIQLTKALIAGLGQKNFIIEQTKSIKNPKYQKQATLQQWFKEIVNRRNPANIYSSVENPFKYTLSTLYVLVGLPADHEDPDQNKTHPSRQ